MIVSNNDQLIQVVTRVSKAELKAQKAINQLLKTGVKTLNYDREKLEITTTTESGGVIQTQTIKFGDICNQMEMTFIDVNDKGSRDANIVEMYKNGCSQAELARMNDLSQTRIHKILKNAGAL